MMIIMKYCKNINNQTSAAYVGLESHRDVWRVEWGEERDREAMNNNDNNNNNTTTTTIIS